MQALCHMSKLPPQLRTQLLHPVAPAKTSPATLARCTSRLIHCLLEQQVYGLHVLRLLSCICLDAYQGCQFGDTYQGCFLAYAGMLSSKLAVAGLGEESCILAHVKHVHYS